jgi:hypothetical protein
MNKLCLGLTLVLGACSSNICTMDVASMSAESAIGTVDLIGTFDEASPILILTGSSTYQIVCTQKDGSTIAATCDLAGAGVAAGSYAVTFDMTCHDSSASKDALAIGNTIPAMFTVN